MPYQDSDYKIQFPRKNLGLPIISRISNYQKQGIRINAQKTYLSTTTTVNIRNN